jgi:hypothetical protein
MNSLKPFKSISFLFAVYALSACASTDDKTQLTLGITSEAFVSDELDEIKVYVTPNGGSRTGGSSIVRPGDGFLTNRALPGTSAIIPSTDKSFSGPVLIEVFGYKDGTPVLTRRSRVSFVKGRNITIPVPLRMACFNQKCSETQTCSGGKCVDPAPLETSKLRNFVDSEIIPLDGASCFDETACLSTSQEVKVDVSERSNPADPFSATCTFPLEATKSKSANVSIQWAAAKSRVIALDEGDEEEGWTRVNETTGKLAPGVCAAYAEKIPFDINPAKNKREVVFDQVLAVAVSYADGCQTRKANSSVPFCKVKDGDQKSVAGAGAQWIKP